VTVAVFVEVAGPAAEATSRCASLQRPSCRAASACCDRLHARVAGAPEAERLELALLDPQVADREACSACFEDLPRRVSRAVRRVGAGARVADPRGTRIALSWRPPPRAHCGRRRAARGVSAESRCWGEGSKAHAMRERAAFNWWELRTERPSAGVKPRYVRPSVGPPDCNSPVPGLMSTTPANLAPVPGEKGEGATWGRRSFIPHVSHIRTPDWHRRVW
jgi:hypothetical protein